jgi:hypothetical protein
VDHHTPENHRYQGKSTQTGGTVVGAGFGDPYEEQEEKKCQMNAELHTKEMSRRD